MCCTDAEILEKAIIKQYSKYLTLLFLSQILSGRTFFNDNLKKMKDIKALTDFLIIDKASSSLSYTDVCTAYCMYLIVPITVEKAELYFQKLKLIEIYLRSLMKQERLITTLLAIENDRATIAKNRLW